jgi:hypothetical protein
MRSLCLLLLPLVLAACAADPQIVQAPAQAPAQADVYCAKESRTGSNRINLQCRSAEQREQDKLAGEALGRSIVRTGVDPTGR